MQKRYREINVFNLSMLDVIAGAMGAFLIIMVILLPYYKNDAVIQHLREQIQQLEQELERQQQIIRNQQQRIQEQTERVEELDRENQHLREQLANTFLIVVIDWKTKNHDVDLHIIDPAENEFYYEKTSFPGVPGELSEDERYGPGVEVWEIRETPAGDYTIYYKLYDQHGNSEPAVVHGRVYFRDGVKNFREIRLARQGEKRSIATITVKSDGQVTVH